MRKLLCTILVLSMILSLSSVVAFAAPGSEPRYTVIETGIMADSVYVTGGYANLSIDADFSGDTGGPIPPYFALINKDGEVIFDYGEFPCKYVIYDGVFVNGAREANGSNDAGKRALFNLDGEQLSDEYDYLSFYNGYGLASNILNPDSYDTLISDTVVIDASGNDIGFDLPEVFDYADSFGWYEFIYETGGSYYVYLAEVGGYGDGMMWVWTSADGRESADNIDDLYVEDEDTIRSKIDDLNYYNNGAYAGYMDMDGNMKIPFMFTYVGPFCEGLAKVRAWDPETQSSTDCYYINTNGERAFEGDYASAGSFINGYAAVADHNGKCGYIDNKGNLVIPLEYDAAFGQEDDGLFAVGNLDDSGERAYYGIVDVNNDVVVPLEYDDITPVQDGAAYAIKDGEVLILRFDDYEEEEKPNYQFNDVSASAYYYTPVKWAVDAGLTSGTSDTTFSPNDVCTRAQVVTFLWRANGCPAPSSVTSPFNDVNPGDYFYEAVLWAKEQGITDGVGNGKFGSMDPVTRAQFVTFLWRANGGLLTSGEATFTDVDYGAFYGPAVAWAVGNEITDGTSATTFGPSETCTRGQVVTFLYRAYE